jgi:hypothetical protein
MRRLLYRGMQSHILSTSDLSCTLLLVANPYHFDSRCCQIYSYRGSSAAPIPIALLLPHDGCSKRHCYRCGRIAGLVNFERETMNSNQKSGVQGGTPEQHAEAGRQSHKNDANRQSGNAGSASGGSDAGGASGGRSVSSGSASGTRGGTPEQHAEAGRQSHKNDGKK